MVHGFGPTDFEAGNFGRKGALQSRGLTLGGPDLAAFSVNSIQTGTGLDQAGIGNAMASIGGTQKSTAGIGAGDGEHAGKGKSEADKDNSAASTDSDDEAY